MERNSYFSQFNRVFYKPANQKLHGNQSNCSSSSDLLVSLCSGVTIASSCENFLSYKAHYNFSRSYERAKLIQTKFFVLHVHVILYCFGVKLNIVRQCFIYLSEFYTLSRRHTWRFYTPIAANLIASENRKRFSPPIDADTPGDFFRRSRRCGSFELM